MHRLHALAWFIDKLVEGNPVAWIFFAGTVIVIGICMIRDLRANQRKDSSGQ